MTAKNLVILLIEDNPAQVRLTQEALKEENISITLNAVYDGEEALEYLNQSLRVSSLPNLILLDWNVPKKNGAQILRYIKNDPQLKSIPVIILTSSERHEDVLEGYELQANCFIKKPQNYDDFLLVLRKVVHFWSSARKPASGILAPR